MSSKIMDKDEIRYELKRMNRPQKLINANFKNRN